MRDEDIHIGDVLRVRQWDNMMREYGIDELGNINTKYVFPKHMQHFCGRRFQVTNLSNEVFGKLYAGIIFDAVKPSEYQFASDELEPLFDEDWEVADDEQIKLLFG